MPALGHSLEMDLAVAVAATRAAIKAIEDNADRDDPTLDAETLSRVYAHLLDARAGAAGALAVVRMRAQLIATLESADTVPAPPLVRLRLVK